MDKTLEEWIADKGKDWKIYSKRLSSNDTGMTGGHQVGIYMPTTVMKELFPEIQRIDKQNPDAFIRGRLISHSLPEQTLRAVYYNSKPRRTGTRNEQRITRWNTGVSDNPLLDHDNTGALCLFSFHSPKTDKNAEYLEIWLCNNPAEEEFIESIIGDVIPGDWHFGDIKNPDKVSVFDTVTTTSINYPDKWKTDFPGGKEILGFITGSFDDSALSPDERLVKRRDREFSIFREIEEEHVLEQIQRGFDTVDEFFSYANSVTNRRRSRSGKSLELQLEVIFREEGLNSFDTQCSTEGNKKPDFIFPACNSYHNPDYPVEKLVMLAVKTTCKDRWRQILNEADRLAYYYLFTMQEGVSENQFKEMEAAGVILVVPKLIHTKFPEPVRVKLLSLDQFIENTRNLYNE